MVSHGLCSAIRDSVANGTGIEGGQVAYRQQKAQQSKSSTASQPSTSRAALAAIAGPFFVNHLPRMLAQELATMKGLGVTPLSAGNPGFAAMAEQAAGQINWVVTTEGELLAAPALENRYSGCPPGGCQLQ